MNNFLIKESAEGFREISVESLLLTQRNIFMTEEVNESTCKSIIQQLLYFNKEDPGAEIVMYINSPGGVVYDGLAVYDMMRMMPAPLRTVCIGTAASMGSIFFLAGDKRQMLPHSRIMIHDPALGGGSMAGQKPHQLQQIVDTLNECREITCKIIAERSGHSIEEIYEKTRNDTYFKAEEALEYGLATEIVKEAFV